MSNMLLDLVGRRCLIKNADEEYLTGSGDITCHVLAADDEWIKLCYIDGVGNRVTRLERTENLECVLIFEDYAMQ